MDDMAGLAEAARRELAAALESPAKALTTALPLLAIIVAVQWYRSYSRLSQFPGPRLAAWTKLPLIRWSASGRAHLQYLELTETYGPLVRIAPNILLTSDPDLMNRIAAPRSPYRRNDWYKAFRFNPERDNLVSCLDEETHSALRAKMSRGYSGKEIVALEEKIDSNVLAFLNLIETKYLSQPTETKAFDLAQKAQYFTIDTISDVSFGKPLGFLAEDRDMFDYIKTSAEAFPFFIVLSLFPALVRLLQLPMMKKYLPSTNDTFGMGKIMGIAQERAGERYEGKSDDIHQDMLGSFVRHGLTREEAESESVLQLLAGADTTATAVRVTLFYVFNNPRVLAKLRAEIARARPPSPIPDEAARKLPYLQAVIREALRICPPITGLVLKNVPRGGDTFKGTFIPGGTAIGYSVMSVMRDRKTWGDDADSFRPERFLDGQDDDELRMREAALEHVFGYGRWRCLGRNIALVELNKVVVEVVRTFDFTAVDPTKPFTTFDAGVQVQTGMWMRATRAGDD